PHPGQLTDLRYALPFTSARGGGDDPHPAGAISGALQDHRDACRLVERRIRVRHGTDRGESTMGCGAGAALDRFGAFQARLAEVRMEVAEPGSDDQAMP